jgi:predicted dinucleotide-binding enzyme
MDSGRVGDHTLTALVAGDDAGAKQTVLELAHGIGFDAVDAGPLKNARLIEPFGYLNIQLGCVLGLGTQIGFKLLHGEPAPRPYQPTRGQGASKDQQVRIQFG